jgi:Transposon-encoded protein TnpV
VDKSYQSSLAQQYGEEHLTFLRENNPSLLKDLKESGDLEDYLHSVGNQAEEMLNHEMARHGNSPAVQSLPYQKRVESLQNLHRAMEEIIRHDLIHRRNKRSADRDCRALTVKLSDYRRSTSIPPGGMGWSKLTTNLNFASP